MWSEQDTKKRINRILYNAFVLPCYNNWLNINSFKKNIFFTHTDTFFRKITEFE